MYKKNKLTETVVITAVITALLASGITYLFVSPAQKNTQITNMQARVESLKEEKAALAAEKEQLEIKNTELKEEITVLREQTTVAEINRKPKAGWEAYFPTMETTTLAGRSVTDLREILGEPPVLVRSIATNPQFNREIWVFMPFDQDPTGLYLFFKAGQLIGSRLDEFPGLHGSGLLDDVNFWS